MPLVLPDLLPADPTRAPVSRGAAATPWGGSRAPGPKLVSTPGSGQAANPALSFPLPPALPPPLPWAAGSLPSWPMEDSPASPEQAEKELRPIALDLALRTAEPSPPATFATEVAVDPPETKPAIGVSMQVSLDSSVPATPPPRSMMFRVDAPEFVPSPGPEERTPVKLCLADAATTFVQSRAQMLRLRMSEGALGSSQVKFRAMPYDPATGELKIPQPPEEETASGESPGQRAQGSKATAAAATPSTNVGKGASRGQIRAAAAAARSGAVASAPVPLAGRDGDSSQDLTGVAATSSGASTRRRGRRGGGRGGVASRS